MSLHNLIFDPTVDRITAALAEQMKLQIARGLRLPMSLIDGRPWVPREDECP